MKRLLTITPSMGATTLLCQPIEHASHSPPAYLFELLPGAMINTIYNN